MDKSWHFQSFSNQECLNWEFQQYQSQYKDQVDLSIKNEPLNQEEMLKKRQSHKNKYVNKIKECLPQETNHSNKRIANPSEISKDPSEMKKYKNRQAAKQSRQRKKIYISLVQEQTRKLQAQIQLTTREIQKCKMQIHGNNFNGNQYLSTFNRKMHHILIKLQKLLENEQTQEINNQINLAVDSILYRFGPNGKERNMYIKDALKQIISLCLPHIQKYIAWSARQQVHMFKNHQNPNENKKDEKQLWFRQFYQYIQYALQGQQGFLSIKRQEITEKLQQILANIVKLSMKNKDISSLSNKIDNAFLEIRDILTPFQVTKFIMFVEKYKHREEFREGQQFQKQKEKIKSQHEDDERFDIYDRVKKHIKLEQAQDDFFQ